MTPGANVTSSTEDQLGPWDLMQQFDAARFGPDIFDREQQARWSHAMFIGGLPYMWRLARPVLGMIYDLAELKQGDKVLLFGESLESCGFIADLNAIVGRTGEVKSIDIQEDARNAVAARKSGVGGMIGTFRYNYTNDIPDETFDIVLNLQGIQHTDDWTATGKEFLRIMKPGRRLVMAEIVLGSPEQVMKIKSDLHIQHLFDKIFSRRGIAFSELPYYSPEDLMRAFDGLLADLGQFEWRGLEVFWGRKP
jgi:SAM-dependent methyltransferase